MMKWLLIIKDICPDDVFYVHDIIKNTVIVTLDLCFTDEDCFEVFCYFRDSAIDYILNLMRQYFPVYILCEDRIPKDALPLFYGRDCREYENGFLLVLPKNLPSSILIQLSGIEKWFGNLYIGTENSYYVVFGYTGITLEGFPPKIFQEICKEIH